MNAWKKINEASLYYIKYTSLPNLIAFSLAYAYFNKIQLNMGLKEYFNNIFALFNICNIDIKEQFKLVDNILINKYNIMIVDVDNVEMIKIKK